MDSLLYISEKRVSQLLNWESTYDAVEKAMKRVSEHKAVQNPKTFTMLPDTGDILITLPGYLNDDVYGSLGCKLLTIIKKGEEQRQLPTINATIVLFDEHTGLLKAVVGGTEVTSWRTAAASVVATKYILKDEVNGKEKVLAVFGAGTQGRIHAIAFQHFFKFKEVHIWNRTMKKAETLKEELEKMDDFKGKIFVHETVESCAKNADVIVTATSSDTPFLKKEFLKQKVHINAIGIKGAELEESIYLFADVFVDDLLGARSELGYLQRIGIKFKGEVGDLISKRFSYDHPKDITIFESLGMAVEDTAMARLIYDLHVKN